MFQFGDVERKKESESTKGVETCWNVDPKSSTVRPTQLAPPKNSTHLRQGPWWPPRAQRWPLLDGVGGAHRGSHQQIRLRGLHGLLGLHAELLQPIQGFEAPGTTRSEGCSEGLMVGKRLVKWLLVDHGCCCSFLWYFHHCGFGFGLLLLSLLVISIMTNSGIVFILVVNLRWYHETRSCSSHGRQATLAGNGYLTSDRRQRSLTGIPSVVSLKPSTFRGNTMFCHMPSQIHLYSTRGELTPLPFLTSGCSHKPLTAYIPSCL